MARSAPRRTNRPYGAEDVRVMAAVRALRAAPIERRTLQRVAASLEVAPPTARYRILHALEEGAVDRKELPWLPVEGPGPRRRYRPREPAGARQVKEILTLADRDPPRSAVAIAEKLEVSPTLVRNVLRDHGRANPPRRALHQPEQILDSMLAWHQLQGRLPRARDWDPSLGTTEAERQRLRTVLTATGREWPTAQAVRRNYPGGFRGAQTDATTRIAGDDEDSPAHAA